ncbi:MAG: hypothetical protein NC393_07375 [Clostridium sp.]|nr:hypothetical protein [Clostridium sp.]MCM1207908.1 hypothetical protein [Ruminococcus sp.]
MRDTFQEWMQKLGPIIYYGDICNGDVQLCVLSKRPNDKAYAYCDAMFETGNLEMIICLTDRCVVGISSDFFDKADEWSKKILSAVLELGTLPDWYGKYYMEKEKGNWPMKMELDDKLTTGFIEAYIPSIDTAAYLRSIGHQFSQLEKATIIGNHYLLSAEEKLEALQRLKEFAEDKELCDRLEQAIQLIQENKGAFGDCSAWDVFHDFFPIPHDFRHGDIVCLVGNKFRSVLGVILGYDEKAYEFYLGMSGDYGDVQIAVDTRFLLDGYDWDYHPEYDYLGEFSHKHINPIYIERARLGHENECGWYLQYLAACGTPNEKNFHMLVYEVITKQLKEVWQYYRELSLMELIITAAKTAREQLGLPEADAIDMAKVKDFEVMDGLFKMLPQKVKDDIWKRMRKYEGILK